MNITPHYPSQLRARIELPSSKSLSNRAMLLCALSGTKSRIERISPCDDTRVMQEALSKRPAEVNILAAGTAMRFLTAYFATQCEETHVMTGTERMQNRPISVLVDALRSLGADIQYTNKEGFPPLRITGRKLSGGKLSLPASVSSQYISALLMIAPMMTEGLTLNLVGDIISRPYIDMTLAMMQKFGAKAQWTTDHSIHVERQAYNSTIYTAESDWSAASYWYEAVALSEDKAARIELPYLFEQSLQGDSAVQTFFHSLGVKTTFDRENCSAILTKNELATVNGETGTLQLNLINQPDLAQTLVVTCALQLRPFCFTGLRSLRIKETDRIAALTAELAKFGVQLGVIGDGTLYIKEYPAEGLHYNGQPIYTYADHRMALAFAPAALRFPNLVIADAEVVSKSYPQFWQTLKELA